MKRKKSCIVRILWIVALGMVLTSVIPNLYSQSDQNQSSPVPPQDIPDTPSAVQPTSSYSPAWETLNQTNAHLLSRRDSLSIQESAKPFTSTPPEEKSPDQASADASSRAGPQNHVNFENDLYKIMVSTSFVQIPVMIKNSQGGLVHGLLARDFIVKENGEPQALTFFSSDPFPLSVAIVLDFGMADVAVQKVNETYASLVGAFSPYDECALYTYSSVVSRVSDFTGRADKLMAALDSIRFVAGHFNGPPILSGPLGPQPLMINGSPVGIGGPALFFTPPKEAHVLNDAILRAALDLSKRENTRRKVILVISDGRERGSQSTFKQVTTLLQTQGIQVKALVLDLGALPIYKEVARVHHVLWQGSGDMLSKYVYTTGGGVVFRKLSQESIEHAYAEITSEARNQYTLGYNHLSTKGGTPYRNIEVIVDRKNLRVYAKEGYYPAPSIHESN